MVINEIDGFVVLSGSEESGVGGATDRNVGRAAHPTRFLVAQLLRMTDNSIQVFGL